MVDRDLGRFFFFLFPSLRRLLSVFVAVSFLLRLRWEVFCPCSHRFPCLRDRSIYPDEFDNFVERMRGVSNSKSKRFLFEVDVMDPLLIVVLDTNLGADLSRDR